MPAWLHSFVHRPQRVWLRRALFQIHLWAGLIVGLYIIVIGLSGSILVFQEELTSLGRPRMASVPPDRLPDLLTLADGLRARYPNSVVEMIFAPGPGRLVISAYLEEGKKSKTIDLDPVAGRELPSNRWLAAIEWVEDLHIFLLAGGPGLIANGVGAICLLLLCVTGLVLWWPGIRRWKRALVLDWRANWRRINFDLHSVFGFWPLALIGFWSVSGIYFAWPAQFVGAVNMVLPVGNGGQPKYDIKPDPAGRQANIRGILAQAQALAPNGTLAGIGFSHKPTEPIVISMARDVPGDLLGTDYTYFNQRPASTSPHGTMA